MSTTGRPSDSVAASTSASSAASSARWPGSPRTRPGSTRRARRPPTPAGPPCREQIGRVVRAARGFSTPTRAAVAAEPELGLADQTRFSRDRAPRWARRFQTLDSSSLSANRKRSSARGSSLAAPSQAGREHAQVADRLEPHPRRAPSAERRQVLDACRRDVRARPPAAPRTTRRPSRGTRPCGASPGCRGR